MSDGWPTVDCTEKCWRIVYCAVCGRMKNPIGRSAPMEMTNGLCDHECPGYKQELGRRRPMQKVMLGTQYRLDGEGGEK